MNQKLTTSIAKKPIVLAITTMNDRAHQALAYFSQFADSECHIYISHQITDQITRPLTVSMPYVWYSSMTETWLSASRNHILDQLDSGIFVICDDDVQLVDGFVDHIRRAYALYLDADATTFQTILPEWWLRKPYFATSKIHSRLSILSVSSIEITFDIARVKSLWVRFDEQFGLWTLLPGGEENIFLSDVIWAWGKCIYVPFTLSAHPAESSNTGKIDRSHKKHIFQRIFGTYIWTISVIVFRWYKYLTTLAG